MKHFHFLGENKLTCLTSGLSGSINSDFHTFGINSHLWRTCADANSQIEALSCKININSVSHSIIK